MSEAIKAAAKKWFYQSFDCDLLEKMQQSGLIAQAEGFSISVMVDLELDMEAAFQSELAALREENQDALAVNRTLNAQIDSLQEELGKLEEGMRALACSLGAGGYNAETLTADQLVGKVQWGIDHLMGAHGQRLTVAEQRNAELLEILRSLRLNASPRLFSIGQLAQVDAALTESVRQYYYRVDACKALNTTDPECKCWHDEGTGPLFNNPLTNTEPKSWRAKPTESGASE